ncbi:phage tail tape measure protein [Rhodobacteraceae bacterium Araon29]
MTESQSYSELQDQLDAVDAALGATTSMADDFNTELRKTTQGLDAAKRSSQALQSSLDGGLRKAIDGVILDGEGLSNALKHVGTALANTAYNTALKPITGHLAGLMTQGVESIFGSAWPFAKGEGFTSGRVMPFAQGGVVGQPTLFPMRGGVGLMGEAGPEAILPLARGRDGKLGVRGDTGSSAPAHVVINITTPDVEGFRRSQTQIAAQVRRALGSADRNR